MMDLFAAFADELEAAPPAPVAKAPAQPKSKTAPICQPATVPQAGQPRRPYDFPRNVASFACPCGWRDEVREPAPATLPCLDTKCGGTMRRWTPRVPPPIHNARRC